MMDLFNPHFQIIQLLYLHSECHCSGWSGDIHYNIHTRMFQGYCGTFVSILHSLLNTRWYLKTDKPRKLMRPVSFKARVLIRIQKNDWYSYTENNKLSSNQQQYSFIIGWLGFLVYGDQRVMVIMFWWCRKRLLWVLHSTFYMLPIWLFDNITILKAQ